MAGPRIDPVCVLCALLFLVTNSMDIAIRWKHVERRHFNYRSWRELDVDYLKEEWAFRNESKALETVAGLLGAFTWFILCMPIIEASWFLSRGGKKRTAPHIFVVIFAVGSSFTELMSRLMFVGTANTAEWITSSFDLDSWNGAWQSFELTFMLLRGAIIWIDAFEYFSLFIIMILLCLAVWAEHNDGLGSETFGNKWAGFGLVIATFCLIEFAADIMRFIAWGWYMKVSIIISIFNSVIALPIWLLILGAQLPKVRSHYESSVQESSSSETRNETKANGTPGTPPPAGAFQRDENFQSDIVVTGAELS